MTPNTILIILTISLAESAPDYMDSSNTAGKLIHHGLNSIQYW